MVGISVRRGLVHNSVMWLSGHFCQAWFSGHCFQVRLNAQFCKE